MQPPATASDSLASAVPPAPGLEATAEVSSPQRLLKLLLTPAKVRWRALKELWLYRRYWRLPGPRQAMQHERDSELAGMIPFVALLAVLAAVLLQRRAERAKLNPHKHN